MTGLVLTFLGCVVCAVFTYRREAREWRERWRQWQLGRWRAQARELEARAERMERILRALARPPGIEVIRFEGARAPRREWMN